MRLGVGWPVFSKEGPRVGPGLGLEHFVSGSSGGLYRSLLTDADVYSIPLRERRRVRFGRCVPAERGRRIGGGVRRFVGTGENATDAVEPEGPCGKLDASG